MFIMYENPWIVIYIKYEYITDYFYLINTELVNDYFQSLHIHPHLKYVSKTYRHYWFNES